MATHSPILMALPNARLLEIKRHGIAETTLEETQHFKLFREFIQSPSEFVADAFHEMKASREADQSDQDGNLFE
ncbi:hypothetical protein [Shimia haliotis]|nr:hypothetical protein [Shimia haliotis]